MLEMVARDRIELPTRGFSVLLAISNLIDLIQLDMTNMIRQLY